MSALVPFRSCARNIASTSTAANQKLHVVAYRILTDDRQEVAIRGELTGNLDQAKRHAALVAGSIANRFDCEARCHVNDHDGKLLFTCTVGMAQ